MSSSSEKKSDTTEIDIFCHELSTPVGVWRSGLSAMRARIKQLETQFHEGVIKRSDLDSCIKENSEIAEILESNLRRITSLIHKYSQCDDQSCHEPSRLELGRLLKIFWRNLSPLLDMDIQLSISGDRVDIASDDESIFADIFLNLYSNSITHGFRDRDQGKIHIEIEDKDGQVKITYRDDGQGVAEDILPQIFQEAFSTRHSKRGHGFGLFFVKQQVERRLHGTIHCHSDKGHGFQLQILFNIKKRAGYAE